MSASVAPVETAQAEMTSGSVCHRAAHSTERAKLIVADDPLTIVRSAAEISTDRANLLTARQAAILDFIRDHIRSYSRPPTLREIGKQFSIRSTNGVNDHLRALERKGYLRRWLNKARGMVPTDLPQQNVPANEAALVASLREDCRRYRTLLQRTLDAGGRLPRLTPEMVTLLCDVRDMLRTRDM